MKKLGVDILWLTPIYQSPQKDNGYDIRNYFSIDPMYGTMEDFEELLYEAHQRNLKIIMDLVLNHTSTEHERFKKSASSRNNPYRDYYIWKDPVDGKEPNNWQSKFGGSAWQFDEKTGQYYLHLKVDYSNGEKWTKAPFDFIELKKILSKWQVGMNEGGGWNALFWCNHDQPRIVSRFGDEGKYHKESAKMLATTPPYDARYTIYLSRGRNRDDESGLPFH